MKRTIPILRGSQTFHMTLDTGSDTLLARLRENGETTDIYIHKTTSGEAHYFGHTMSPSREDALKLIRREKAVRLILCHSIEITHDGHDHIATLNVY